MYMDVQSLRIAWLKYIEIIDALVRLGGERLCEITPFRTCCYGFSSPQRLYEKVSTHPHLNPHGCCLTFPLLHIRVCVKNRAPTKTHCLKPHCGFRQTIIYWWWICPPFPVLVDTPMVAGGRDTLLDKAIQGCIILSTTCHIWGDEHPQLF